MGTTPLPNITLRYSGLYDFDSIYAAVIDWAKNYGYMWHEKTYKHKVPKPTGAEQEFDWLLTKKVNSYIHYTIRMNIHTWDQTEAEVEINGKKKILQTGRIYFVMNGTMKWDWMNKFKGNSEWMGKIYDKVYAKEIDSNYGDTLWYRMWNLNAVLKKLLDMQTKKYAYEGYIGEH